MKQRENKLESYKEAKRERKSSSSGLFNPHLTPSKNFKTEALRFYDSAILGFKIDREIESCINRIIGIFIHKIYEYL